MKLDKVFLGLDFLSKVSSKRLDYFVYASKDDYVIVSSKDDRSGNYSMVDKEVVEKVYQAIKGTKGITSNDVSQLKKPGFVFRRVAGKNQFSALHCLYVLIALRKAKIDHRHVGRSLVFNIRNRG
jgi:hypothetical protein